jgi:hypothetical protein
MGADSVFKSADDFSSHLYKLRKERRIHKREVDKRKPKRVSLSSRQRHVILAKTASRCHICGGLIKDREKGDADHVFAHAQGGVHSMDNYLPAHSLCNNYRWNYSAEELQWVLKLGVWLRTLIIRRKDLALELAQRFVKHEMSRDQRRKPKPTVAKQD